MISRRWIHLSGCAAIASVPLLLFGFSTGPPIKRTGAPVDGGLDCTACHRTFAPANSGSGRVRILTGPYTPGVKQNITIMIEDPDAMRWGFELTARHKSDETKMAGSFTPTDLIRVVCDPDARPAPCNGDLEFATHRQVATQAGTPVRGMFTVEWTPPDSDVGEVVFYAAGNAANNNNANTGDHIYTTSAIVRPVCNLTQKPTVSAVADAASFRSNLGNNALVAIFGGPFASSNFIFNAARSDLVDGKAPTELQCIGVEIAGRRVPVIAVSANQIAAQAPLLNLVGPVDVRVIVNPDKSGEQRSDALRAPFQFVAPALFTFNGKTIAALNASADNRIVADPSVVAGAAPAHPGDIVALFGTGFGVTDPVFQPGEFADQLASIHDPVTITIGGTTLAAADVLYAGLSSAAPGLYQFNVRLPATLADGDVPVTIRVSGQETQPGVTIPVQR